MNAHLHAELSVKRRGGQISDYYAIHSFLDATKELCSDNRHRILHNLWGVRRVLIPIFGPTLINSDGKSINVKDLCEQDHILPDYKNRFIPTLADFVVEFEELEEDEFQQINDIYSRFDAYPDVQALLISPLNLTGHLTALRITHNSWFCNEIVPQIFNIKPSLQDFGPLRLFEKMNFKLWMDNGAAIPASAKKIQALL